MKTFPKTELRQFRTGQRFIWNDIIYLVTQASTGGMVECYDGTRHWAWPGGARVSGVLL